VHLKKATRVLGGGIAANRTVVELHLAAVEMCDAPAGVRGRIAADHAIVEHQSALVEESRPVTAIPSIIVTSYSVTRQGRIRKTQLV